MFLTLADISAPSSFGIVTAPSPWASCPQQYHSGWALLENSSILFCVGCIREIRLINSSGLELCLVRCLL